MSIRNYIIALALFTAVNAFPAERPSIVEEKKESSYPLFSIFKPIIELFPSLVDIGPKIEIGDKYTNIIIKADQYNVDEITVGVKGRYVTIEGSRKTVHDDRDLASEFLYTATLPINANTSEVYAKFYSDNYLVITTPNKGSNTGVVYDDKIVPIMKSNDNYINKDRSEDKIQVTTVNNEEVTEITKVSTTPVALADAIITTAVPVITTTAAPVITTTAEHEIITTAVPVITTIAVPEITTTAVPEIITTAVPVITTTVAPEITTTAAPKITTTVAPEITTTAAPKITTTAAPEITTTAAPEITTTAAPEVITTAVPEITKPAASEITTTAAPEITTTAAPEIPTVVVPEITKEHPVFTTIETKEIIVELTTTENVETFSDSATPSISLEENEAKANSEEQTTPNIEAVTQNTTPYIENEISDLEPVTSSI
ncbi:mucin-5AC-like [Pieris napi]|uniref:mucin-5AC-like n=1 Tax=Pieris napi TaxID=78633 RepID=UPI001FBA04D4|nr:mucin-5AC-like [Pieris napi]